LWSSRSQNRCGGNKERNSAGQSKDGKQKECCKSSIKRKTHFKRRDDEKIGREKRVDQIKRVTC